MNHYSIAGLDESYPESFFRLDQIFAENVFEILKMDKEGLVIPYLMNDALESFLIFKDWKMTGSFEADIKGKTEASLSRESAGAEQRYVLSVRQGEENAFTIWFSDLILENHAYRYHNMGHFWVHGQEYLRQIVYRLAIMRDKYYYFEDQFCNELEKWLLPLNDFGPLQFYYCVSWVKKEYYGSDEQAIERFLALAKQVNDQTLCRELEKLRKKQTRRRERKIARMLNQAEHFKVIQLLNQKIEEASMEYKIRFFGKREDYLLQECRNYISEKYGRQMEDMQIEMLEKHPFSVWNGDFQCRFYFITYGQEKSFVTQQIKMIPLQDSDKNTIEMTEKHWKAQIDQIFK